MPLNEILEHEVRYFQMGLIYCVILNYLNLSYKKKYNPGKEQIRLKTPYIIATLIIQMLITLEGKKLDIPITLTPHPPILMQGHRK